MFDVNEIRKDFPILQREVYGKPLVYLDNAATSQKPRIVIQALTDYYEQYNSNVHRGVHALSMEATDKYEEARHKVAKFIGAPKAESVIWTRNTTESINLLAMTWGRDNILPGDEIVVTQMEHHSNHVPWQKVAQDQQAVLKVIPLTKEGTLDVSDIDSYITPKTKLVAFCHVSNSLGTINPVKMLTKKARAVGAKVLLDGAQSVPQMPVNVKELDCDFMAFSGHKMMAPTGIGGLYVKMDILEEMEPFMRGGEMVLEVWNDRATWNDLPMKFEAGTPNIADAIAMGAAVDYLSDLGMDNVRKHEAQLTEYALTEMQKIEEIDLLGPMDVDIRGGILPFHNSEIHPHDLGTFLDREAIAIRTGHHCTMPLMRAMGLVATARASLYVYNTEEEVDKLVSVLKDALRYFGDGAKRAKRTR
ncbi:MAG: cysteine desulfurase [Chloroflexi bacterium]|nr:cysteine desulfurase [Chloroflexota bacterium]